MKSCFVVLILFILRPVPTTADIAPVTYNGYTLTPISNTSIRMVEETVDIHLGKRYSKAHYIRRVRVTARFKMENPAPDTVLLHVGFPASALVIYSTDPNDTTYGLHKTFRGYATDGTYDFKVKVNGRTIPKPQVATAEGQFGDYVRLAPLWFWWAMEFPPGATVVDVVYHVKTTYVYKTVRQSVHYIVSTGRYWRGTIGKATIRVHTPSELGYVELGPLWPEDFVREGNTVTWLFEDLEPTRHDDIVFVYMPPDYLSEISALKERISDDPQDVDARIELARICLRATIRGFRNGPLSEFARTAEQQLHDALTIEPGNAEAWNLYLADYYKMHEKAYGMGFYSRYEIGQAQKALIDKAFSFCPNDDGVRLWYGLVNKSMWEPPDTLGYMKRDPFRKTLYVRIGASQMATIDEQWDIEFFERYYVPADSTSGTPLLVLDADGLTAEDKQKIVDRLERHNFYQLYYYGELYRYNRGQW